MHSHFSWKKIKCQSSWCFSNSIYTMNSNLFYNILSCKVIIYIVSHISNMQTVSLPISFIFFLFYMKPDMISIIISGMRRTSNLMIASRMGSIQSWTNRCFLEQEILHSLLSTGWIQEQIRECFYKLTASYTIELK